MAIVLNLVKFVFFFFILSLSSELYTLLTEGIETVEMTPANEDQHQAVDSETNDETTSPLRGDKAEGKKKKKEKKSLMATIFDPFIVLYTGWRTYARQKVVFAGIALATLYMTVLGFDSITTGGCVAGQ